MFAVHFTIHLKRNLTQCTYFIKPTYFLSEDKDYRFPSITPLQSETHGGDDVAIFARGPYAHLFTGTMEQNVIPHLMAYASCVGKGATACENFSAR